MILKNFKNTQHTHTNTKKQFSSVHFLNDLILFTINLQKKKKVTVRSEKKIYF